MRPSLAVPGVASGGPASPLDERPELVIRWKEPRQVRGVLLRVSPDLPASRPLTVTAFAGGLQTTGVVTGSGVLTIPPVVTDEIRLRFDNTAAVRSLNPVTGVFTTLPVGVNEVRVFGVQDILTGPRLFDSVSLPCGFGPEVVVDGAAALETSVSATVTRVLIDDRLSAAPCGGRLVSLDAGEHTIEVASTEEFAIESIALEPLGAQTPWSPPLPPDVQQWDPASRNVVIPQSPGPRILETSENANDGWVATIDGQQLRPVRVDGWRQGWILPPGIGGSAVLTFEPAGTYRLGLGVGLLAVLGLVVMAGVGSRPGRALAAPGFATRGQWLLAGAGLLTAL
ncbi:MAG: hypothetical protein ACKOFP_14545, partial [Actinomycetota bacterium]